MKKYKYYTMHKKYYTKWMFYILIYTLFLTVKLKGRI